jgi:hypothetical protein
MRKLIVGLVASMAIGGTGVAAVASQAAAPPTTRTHLAVVAKTCPSGYTHAIIGGAQKCLHAGEYCAHSHAGQYRRYHYKCVLVNGTYRLEHS